MRKIIVTEFMSLDGVIQAPGGGENYKHAGWSFNYNAEAFGEFKTKELFDSEAQLLGRVTYQGFAAAWPTMEGMGEFGVKFNNMPKYVVSKTLDKVEWNNSHLINGDVIQQIADLKQKPGGDILVAGSAKLVNSLIPHNLIDQFNLLVYPIVLGSGKRLFQDDNLLKLKLVESKSLGAGVMAMIYQPAQD